MSHYPALMASPRRSWFPLAALAFALLGLVVTSLSTGSWFAYTPRSGYQFQVPAGLGTGGVGGTGFPTGTTDVAVALEKVPAPAWGPTLHAGSTAWLIALGVVYLATLAFFTFRRGVRPLRIAGLALGGLAVLVLADLVAFWQLRLAGDVRGPVLAAAALLVLAGYERSLLLLGVAVAFVLVDVVLLGGVVGALAGVAILIAGALAVLLRRPRPTAPDTS